MSNAEIIVRVLGGRKVGRQWFVQCVTHEDRSPSLALRDGDDGRLLVHCFAGCNPLDILVELRRRGLLESEPTRCDRPPPISQPSPPSDSPTLNVILRRCRPIARSPVATSYLPARGVALPNGGDLRYLPPTKQHPWPTMVGIITDFATADRLSLHFTSLSMDGRTKAPIDTPKRFLGGYRKAGGCIRLTDDADVISHLGLAEGIETALAVTAALGTSAQWLPVWSAIDAGNLAGLPVVDGIERLTIFADADSNGVGQAAARTLAARWHAAGREVYIALPPTPPGGKRDWNDGVVV